ncbi:hypothetical protein ACFVZR_02310 [Streptomyces sp. NPDC058316]|uniref:hypothetical protein n=1 Tax=Streptomyces sp. NPDC058316 TaxID=3346442 RepID=UPI0036EB823E
MAQTVARTAPTSGLIARLNVRTWLDHTVDGRMFAPMLITYPAPQFEDADPVEVERQMLGVARSLGAVPAVLGTAHGMAPAFAGRRVTVHPGGDMLVHFDGCSYSLRVTKSPRWSSLVMNLGHVLLAVGLDELSAVASRSEIDEYIEHAGETGRIHATVAALTEARNRPVPAARLA